MTKNKQPDIGKERGLLIRPEFASLFFANPPKTIELRSVNCRCVKPGKSFHIIESGHGKNKHGITVVRVLGTVDFEGNIQIEKHQLASLRDQHRVPDEHLADFSENRKKIVGWKVCNAKPFQSPKWMKWNNQDQG